MKSFYLLGCYVSVIVFLSALTETQFFNNINRVNVIFEKKWVVTGLISTIVSVSVFSITRIYDRYITVPNTQQNNQEIGYYTSLFASCVIFVFAIIAEKNIESSIPFMISSYGLVVFIWCIERLTGWPTFGLPEVLAALVMESSRVLPFPLNYVALLIASFFVFRKALYDSGGREARFWFDSKDSWIPISLLFFIMVCFSCALMYLSKTKVVTETPSVNELVNDWVSFIPIASILSIVHLILCWALYKIIQKDNHLQVVGRYVYIGVCLIIFGICYVANGYVEKSGEFVCALCFLVADLFFIHLISGIPQFGLLEILAAMMIGTAYDAVEMWICFVTFMIGLDIICVNHYLANMEDELHSPPQSSNTTPTATNSHSPASSVGSRRRILATGN